MIKAGFKALGDLLSSDFRGILWRAIGLSLALFIALFGALQAAFWFLTLVPWPWLETLMAIGASLGLLAAFFFLMAPVTAIFAGLYLDQVAEKVERKHYAAEQQGQPLPTLTALRTGLRFGLLVLAISILALPLVFTGFGALALIVINAYLLSREYFELAAMRLMPVAEARDFRKDNAVAVFLAGFLPALLSLVPVVNLAVPLFATSYFIHLFRAVRASSL